MTQFYQLALAALAVVGMQLAPSPAKSASPTAGHMEKPYRLEAVPGSPVKRVVLTQKAADRLDIKTGRMTTDPSGKLVAPYAALFYDLRGEPWVYTSPEPLAYIRARVAVDTIEGANAYLLEGPSNGTQVVVVGVAQLYGTERGVGH